ncbi:efflux RND transporter permease subunit [Thalassolituus sp.]|uniref:efflux RND transporter permease subunit n=1 Tax=Thalassolituus sp. TaxID=2030822 RepID=UPI0032D96FD6
MAILNGVVWMEPINLTVETGTETLYGAIFKGAVSCLHPVLITATVGALGLIPMLLSNGVGSEIQRPLATVIVGGLVTSTLLTLFVLPALYTWFSKAKLEELRG